MGRNQGGLRAYEFLVPLIDLSGNGIFTAMLQRKNHEQPEISNYSHS